MILTNYQIFQYMQNCFNIFENSNLYIPIKANFYIQRNIQLIVTAGNEIEKLRLKIVQHYGSLDEVNDCYIVPPEKIEEANKEIDDLFLIEQDLDIKTIKLEDLGNIELTPKQMQALMFMIEE